MKTQYAKFMAEYISLNHISLISSQVSQKTYFLPYHCVYKLDSTSTKLRVVFDEEETNFPVVAKVTTRDFYVDDRLSGGDSVEEMQIIQKQVAALLKRRNFVIRKWCSNVPTVLKDTPSEQCESLLKFSYGTDITKHLT